MTASHNLTSIVIASPSIEGRSNLGLYFPVLSLLRSLTLPRNDTWQLRPFKLPVFSALLIKKYITEPTITTPATMPLTSSNVTNRRIVTQKERGGVVPSLANYFFTVAS